MNRKKDSKNSFSAMLFLKRNPSVGHYRRCITYPLVIMSVWILILSTTHAQSALSKATFDSLWAVWSNPNQADTNRVNAINRIAWNGYMFSQPDSAFYYAQLLYDFAASKGIKKEMARALNVQGVSYAIRGEYTIAMPYHQKCLKLQEEIGDKKGISMSFNNIGIIYKLYDDYPKALEYHQRSLKILEEMGDFMEISACLSNIGIICFEQNDYPQALYYYQRSLEIDQQIGDKNAIGNTLNGMGSVYLALGKYAKAKEFYQRSFAINEEIKNKMGMASVLTDFGALHKELGDYSMALTYYQKSLRMNQELGNKRGILEVYIQLGQLKNKEKDYHKAISWCSKGLNLAKEQKAVKTQKEACQCLYNAHKAMGESGEALRYLENMGLLDAQLKKEETTKQLERIELERVMFQDSITRAEEARSIADAHREELRKNNQTRNWLMVGGLFSILMALGFYNRWQFVQKSKQALQVERDRSETLLLNILPEEIAAELKEKGRATARDFEQVSVLFTDFKGFTEQSAEMTAVALVNEINHCFEAFDHILEKYGIEKIKTIGDAYMAAGGLPVPKDDSVKNTVLAALEMQQFIRKRNEERNAAGELSFEMRVGIHTGPVVAGIVGVKKFQYDIWGDTVNTANRMESNGEVGKVNISQSTYEQLKDDSTFQFESRGKIVAKGKGEIDMYFVSLTS